MLWIIQWENNTAFITNFKLEFWCLCHLVKEINILFLQNGMPWMRISVQTIKVVWHALTCCQVDQFYFHRFSEQVNSFFILIYKNENKKIKLWNIHHQFDLKVNINKGKIIFNLSSFDVNSFKRLKCKLIILKQKIHPTKLIK